MRILLVEDDARISARLVPALQDADIEVELLVDGAPVVDRILNDSFDAVLLDLNLPHQNGFEILAAVQHRSSTPVLVLTARTDLETRLKAFELGAVDYIPKPCYADELVMRLKARTIRPIESDERKTTWADVEYLHDRLEVQRDRVSLGLTPHEATLLGYLVERVGRPFTRRQLIEAALPWETEAGDRAVDSHIARIRKKLGPLAGKHLKTVHRVGYRFDKDLT
jgi:two-component system, OmpR family, response regulator